MKLMHSALAAHTKGDASGHRRWIGYLLTDYYDPMYDYQLLKRQDRVVFKGTRVEIDAALRAAGIDI